MKGFKNVIFGGEGLFVTTLKGPGIVWLQGMPPDRMISEIVRRLPPGGLGFGIPIGMGGSTGGEGGEATGEEAEEAVAASDAAVEADRQATVASSGVASDPDSPSALFGDAAPEDKAPAAAATDDAPNLQEESSFGQESWNHPEEPTFSGDSTFDDGFGEESFSTEDTFQEDGFPEETSFSTFEESASDATEGGSSIFSTLWDLFTGGND